MTVFGALVLALALSSGCGGDSPTPPDAEVDAPIEDAPSRREIVAPAMPAPVVMPDLLPCPAGWEVVTSAGVPHCNPFPGEGDVRCGARSMRLPGSAQCEPVGVECPAGEFADPLPEGDLLFVAEGAIDGDGTRAHPFGTISEAVAAAPSGATVVIGKGRFVDGLALRRSIRLVGACARGSEIAGPEEETLRKVIDASGDIDVEVRNLVLRGWRAVSATSGARVTITESRVVGSIRASVAPVFVSAAEIEIVRSLVHGGSLFCQEGARCELDEVEVRGTMEMAIVSGSRLVAHRVSLLPDIALGAEGSGVSLAGDATAELREIAHRGRAPSLGVNRGSLVLEDAYFAYDAEPLLSQGVPIQVQNGELALTRVYVGAGLSQGLGAIETDDAPGSARATLRDVVIEGRRAAGVQLSGLPVTFERVAVVDCGCVGLLMTGRASLSATDLLVRGTHRDELGLLQADAAWGVLCVDSTIDLRRMSIAESDDVALALYGDNVASIEDLDVRGAGREFSTGFGLYLDSADVELTRAHVAETRSLGIGVVGGSRLVGTDLTIEDALVGDQDRYGRGVEVGPNASADVLRMRVARARDHGLLVHPGSDVVVAETTIEDVSPPGCVSSSCLDQSFGIGAGVFGARASFDGFGISGSSLCGLRLAAGSDVTLRDGFVADNVVGVCSDESTLDLDDVSDGVLYEGNDQDLAQRRIAVPTAATPPGLEGEP